MISSQNKHPATILCLGPCVHSKKSPHNVFGLMKNVIKYKTVMQNNAYGNTKMPRRLRIIRCADGPYLLEINI